MEEKNNLAAQDENGEMQDLISADEVSKILRKPKDTIKSLRGRNKFPADKKIDGKWYYLKKRVFEFKAELDAKKTANKKIDTPPADNTKSTAGDNTTDINERAEKAVKFLKKHFSGCKGYGYLWLLKKSIDEKITLPFNVESEDEIIPAVKKAFELNAGGYDVYFGVNIGASPCNENARYKEDEITAQVAIIADIDIRNPAHHKGNKSKYPQNIETAVSFLPVKPTFLIFSGGGIHGYWKLETPLTFTTSDERESAKMRGKNFLDVIRDKAGEYKSGVDGVHDLPRVLRLPYSLNCKDKENRQLCYVMEESENYFTLAQIDEIIAASKKSEEKNIPNTNSTKDKVQSTPINNTSGASNYDDSLEYISALRKAQLYAIPPAELSDNNWLAVNSACKNLGMQADLDDWNMQDSARYNAEENQKRLDSLNDSSFGAEILAGKARDFGFSVKDFKRQWYKDNPQFDNRLNKAREYCARAGREFIPPSFFELIEKQISDAEQIAEKVICDITDFTVANIFQYNVLYSAAILKVSVENVGSYELFYQSCKENKINLTRMNELIKRYAEEITSFTGKIGKLKRQNSADLNAAIDNSTEKFVYPAGYEVNDAGIFKIYEKYKVQIARAPIRVTNYYYRTSDGIFLIDLETNRIDGKTLIIKNVDLGDISDARKLTALSARGLSVTSKTAAFLVEYFADYIDANKANLKPKKLLNKLGWYDDDINFFVTPYDDRYNLDIDRMGAFSRSIKKKGSFDEWKKIAREVMEYPLARFTLASCCATPLLNILHERTFNVYTMCDSKAGKSAIARFGGSIWGSQGIVRNLNSTYNGIEGELAESSDFPAIFDEKQLASDKLNMSRLSYLIAQGEGKGRMTQGAVSRERYKWRTIGILGGEEEIVEDTKTQGAITRTLSLTVKEQKIIPTELAQKIYTSIYENFGWAGECFINNLLKENFDNLREKYKEFISNFGIMGEDLIEDYQRYLSVISTADYLMQKYFYGIDDESAMENAIANAAAIIKLIGTAKELSDATREWTVASGWIAENRGLILNNPNLECSVDSNGNVKPPNPNKIIGKYDEGNVYIISKCFNDEMTRRGFNPSKVIRDLIKAGHIIAGKNRPTQTKRLDNEIGITRVLQFKFSFDESEE